MKKSNFLKSWLMILCLLVGVGTTWAESETATLTFTSACGGSGTDDKGNSWVVTSDASESAYDATKGIHYGTKSVAVSYLTLSTSSISGEITQVVVNASGASKTSAKLDVKVGGNAFGSQASLTSSNAAYTFTGSASGNIEISLTQTSATGQALYVKSVAVTYSTAADTRTAVNMTGFSATATTLIKDGTTITSVSNDQNSWTPSYTYESSNTSVATVSNTGVITAVAKGTATITASLNIANDDASWKKGATASKSIDITVNNPSHVAKFSVNGTINDSDNQDVEEGSSITFPEDPADIAGKKFVGWAEATISGVTQTAPSLVTSATMGTVDKNFYAVFATVTGEEETDKTFYFEPFAGSAHSAGFASDNVAATQDMFSDKEATVWSHYTDTKAPSTTSYATNLDGSGMSNGIKIYQQINNTTKTILEVKGIDISNGKNLALSLYNRRSYTTATLIVEYKIDNAATYSSVGGTIKYNSTNDNWKYCDGLTISGTGSTLDLKISVKVTGTTNRVMLIDDVKLYGKHGGASYSDYCTTVAYTRSVTDGYYGTICLPYAVAAEDYEGAIFCNLVDKTMSEGVMTSMTLEEEEGDLVAGKPYIFKATAGEIVLKYHDNNKAAGVVAANGLIGNLGEAATITKDAGNYVISGTQFYLVDSEVNCGTNRAYINAAEITSAPVRGPRFVIGETNVVTAIENAEAAKEATKMFINGQLYIVREGKTYDMVGNLVK